MSYVILIHGNEAIFMNVSPCRWEGLSDVKWSNCGVLDIERVASSSYTMYNGRGSQ